LRIGVSAAKGFCYALDIPLLAVNTLESLAYGMRGDAQENDLLCPMLDARRMEVYCAVFNREGKEIQSTSPLIIDVHSFSELLSQQPVLFAGDGMPKCKSLLREHANTRFSDALPAARNMILPAVDRFAAKQFEDLAWFEPFYLKTFHPGPQRSAGHS
jgi:tRNA threonylcarbamoyladenosine biosynthesis protein TsaB